MLYGKKILLGISGSIAAYKSATLTRLLVKSGAEVKIVMTRSATDFITPITLSTLSKNNVITDIHSDDSWNNHVELGLWADVMLIAPASANTLAKLANGLCDNMLTACYLSAKCPVWIAPAMDLDMWKHPATQLNIQKLQSYGNQLLPVGVGELASGLTGPGRMAEPEEIIAFLATYFQKKDPFWEGKSVLITAGPTYENIDPVRFIGNRSTGKMGVALASVLQQKGANVQLVLGPSSQPIPLGVVVHRVQSAQEMLEAAQKYYSDSAVTILCAAVADYRPKTVATQKIKKKSDELTVELVKNPDIAATLGITKQSHQLLIGFALETENEVENAIGKIERKNLDAIVLNSLNTQGAGFGHDTNDVSFIQKNGKVVHSGLLLKTNVAEFIVEQIKHCKEQ